MAGKSEASPVVTSHRPMKWIGPVSDKSPVQRRGQDTFDCKVLCSNLFVNRAVVALQPLVGLASSSCSAYSKHLSGVAAPGCKSIKAM